MNKLPESKVFQFSVFGAASALVTTVPVSMATFFLVNDLAVSLAVSAIMLSVMGVIEVLLKLSSGIIIQKVNMKWGKYRSWIIVLRWSIALGSIVLFINTQTMPVWVRVTVFSVGYLALYASLAFTQTAHYMLITKMAETTLRDRLRLSIRNAQVSMILTYVITYLGLPLSVVFSSLNTNTQPTVMMNILYIPLFLFGAFLLTRVSKPYDVPYTQTQL